MAAKKSGAEEAIEVFTLSTGVQFTARPMNSIIIYEAQKQIPYPEPPVVKIKQRGQERWVENTSDPIYVERFEDAQRDRNMAAMDAMIRFGVALASPLPKDPSWLNRISQVLDLSRYEDDSGEISDLETLQYLYIRYVGIQDQSDYQTVSQAVVPSEEGVSEAMDQFPDN